MRVAVAGGSAAGLLTGLLLARAGHHVQLVDQDPLAPEPSVDAAAAAAFRQAAPQVVQPHAVLCLCRELMMELLPDVYQDLLAAGMTEAPLSTQLPPTLQDHTPRPGDERLTTLFGRRSTFDWVLRRAAARQPGLDLRADVRAVGLTATPGTPPRVVGLRTTAGDVAADLVVDATGRRTHVDRWLKEVGAPATALREDECGLAYYSRHYRVLSRADRDLASVTRLLVPLPRFTVGIWGGDHGTMMTAVAPLMEDKTSRAFADADAHASAIRTVPALSAWLDRLEPTGPVIPMGGLRNSLRRLVVDGSPVALGVTCVGDSACTTNPTFGRGLSFAVQGAADLVQSLAHHGNDLLPLARDLDSRVSRVIEPFYLDQAANDAARLAQMRHEILGAPLPSTATAPDRVTIGELRTAAMQDPDALRAFWQLFGMLRQPDEVYGDPVVVARTRAVLAAPAAT